MHTYIYIYIYIRVHLSRSLSLSLYIYTYIYIYICIYPLAAHRPDMMGSQSSAHIKISGPEMGKRKRVTCFRKRVNWLR